MKISSKTIILIVLSLVIIQSFILVLRTYEITASLAGVMKPTAKATSSGTVNFCINSQPTINISLCSDNATQDVNYSCWINATDVDYVTFSYSSVFAESYRAFNNYTGTFFNATHDGFVNFTPTNDEVGNYTIQFAVNDGMGCSNSEGYAYLSLRVLNVNDPPYLAEVIPDQRFDEGETISGLYLDNYFIDPDLDDLNYTISSTQSVFTININPNTSEVSISSSSCDVTGYAMFIASDPYNETAESNLVMLKCINEPEPSDPGDAGEGSKSGGGGAGAVQLCIPEYECYEYRKCNRSNVKLENCIDGNGCQDDVILTVPCKYEEEIVCNESWVCSKWNACLPNSTQLRTCEDLAKCGTELLMPNLVQECIYIGTCEDGIKNCHDGNCEEGIDCSGPCMSCKSIEVPYPFPDEKGIIVYFVTGGILLLLTAVLLYHYFHKEINTALAKAAWLIKRRRKKQVLLSIEEKRKLLAALKEAETKLESGLLYEAFTRYATILRNYMLAVCGKELDSAFDMNELKKALEKRKSRIIEIIRRVLSATFSTYVKIESTRELVTKRNILLLVEELRNLIIQTSVAEQADLEREVKELMVGEKATPAETVTTMITNTYIALEFTELEVAKNKYLEIIALYERLGVKEQELVFEHVTTLYHNITYVNSWAGTPQK